MHATQPLALRCLPAPPRVVPRSVWLNLAHANDTGGTFLFNSRLYKVPRCSSPLSGALHRWRGRMGDSRIDTGGIYKPVGRRTARPLEGTAPPPITAPPVVAQRKGLGEKQGSARFQGCSEEWFSGARIRRDGTSCQKSGPGVKLGSRP